MEFGTLVEKGDGESSGEDEFRQKSAATGALLSRTRLALAVSILRQKPAHLSAQQYTRQLQTQALAGQLEERKRCRLEIASLKRRLVEQEVNQPEVNVSLVTAPEAASWSTPPPSGSELDQRESAAGSRTSGSVDETDTALLDACLRLTSCSGGGGRWNATRLRALHRVLDAVSVRPERVAASTLAVTSLLRLDRGCDGSTTSPRRSWSGEVREAVRRSFRLILEHLLQDSDCRLRKEESVDVFRRLLHGPRLRLCLLEALLELVRLVAQCLASSVCGGVGLPPPSLADDAGLLFSLMERALCLSRSDVAALPPPLLVQWRQLEVLCAQRHLLERFPLFVYRLRHVVKMMAEKYRQPSEDSFL